uniref:Putative secreted protein n=1 Tax=Anopheles darlingi TaxID=43151 RepID=A0A2M4DLS0_ANODA
MMWTLSKSSRLSISAAAAVVTASFAAALRGKMLHLAGPSPPINITSTSQPACQLRLARNVCCFVPHVFTILRGSRGAAASGYRWWCRAIENLV